jgi:monofunctional biosynthetic peptidoglycan transglycosylase
LNGEIILSLSLRVKTDDKIDLLIEEEEAQTEITPTNIPLDIIYEDDLIFYRPLSQISPGLKDFVIMLEDAKFFSHSGFDVAEIKKSLEANIEKGKVKRGASTITQQLAKNLFLGKERTWVRKFFEVPWTIKLEEDLSKSQILELYLNVIEWGPGIRGAEAASRHFFDKSAAELSLGQAMYLALIIPNPVRFDLFEHPQMQSFLEKKKTWLVERLVDEKKIPPEEKENYLATGFDLVEPSAHVRFPMSHDASYPGARDSIKNPQFRYLLEKNQEVIRGNANGQIETTLDATLLNKLAAIPLIDTDATPRRYLILREEGMIRGFRLIEHKKELQADALKELCLSPYSCSYEDTLEWKNLAP